MKRTSRTREHTPAGAEDSGARGQHERRRDRPAARLRALPVAARAVAQPAAGDQRRRAAAVEVDRGLAPSRPSARELLEREAGVVARAAVAGDRDDPPGARPSAARGWRPSVMSESNWRAPAEKPSGSPARAYATAPPATSSGPACRRSPRGAARERVARRRSARRRPARAGTSARSPHGASKGTWRRATPRVRSSPSGTPAGRVKKPPTSASCTPRAAHQVARRA